MGIRFKIWTYDSRFLKRIRVHGRLFNHVDSWFLQYTYIADYERRTDGSDDDGEKAEYGPVVSSTRIIIIIGNRQWCRSCSPVVYGASHHSVYCSVVVSQKRHHLRRRRRRRIVRHGIAVKRQTEPEVKRQGPLDRPSSSVQSRTRLRSDCNREIRYYPHFVRPKATVR